MVLSTGLADETAKLVNRFESIVRTEGGTVDANRDWGVRDLAYPIGKQRQGHYFLLEYKAEPNVVAELERNLRIAEGVMRFTSVQQEHTGLPEPRVYREYSDRRDTPLSELRAGAEELEPLREELDLGEESTDEITAIGDDGEEME
ncbi:MAG: 30S ribosomal protein S6 [Deltaproteobacteria bacterium]|nr:30S ribosomal protein S6 [Deltaproteobacteria bacterium]